MTGLILPRHLRKIWKPKAQEPSEEDGLRVLRSPPSLILNKMVLVLIGNGVDRTDMDKYLRVETTLEYGPKLYRIQVWWLGTDQAFHVEIPEHIDLSTQEVREIAESFAASIVMCIAVAGEKQ